MPLDADWVAAVAAVAAVVVAVVALGISVLTSKRQTEQQTRQNELQARIVALETTREEARLRQSRSAELRARVDRRPPSAREAMIGRSPEYRLQLVNEGPSSARAVRVLIDGLPMLEHPLILRGDDGVATLGPGADASYILAVDLSSPRIVHIDIAWSDDSGEARSWQSDLKIS